LTVALLVGPDHAAFGASFTADSTVDAADANPGDGVCATASGACTLRAAIQETNALPGADTISLSFETYNLSIPGANEDADATGDLDITDDLTITGAEIISDGTGGAFTEPGSFIDGGGIDRVLHILGDVTVDISGVVVQNGDVTPVFSDVGGIFNSGGTVALTNSVVRDNRASGVAGVGNSGTMSLTRVTVADNFAAVIGGIGNGGFGVPATLTMDRSTVSGNIGGGIFNATDASLTILNSAIRGNIRGGFGGAISNNGELIIADTSITGNSSAGGAIEHRLGTATLTNVTIAGNVAKSAGGAIFNDGGGQMTLVNSTLSGNSALSDIGPFGPIPGRGGAIYTLSGNVKLSSVTVVDNAADDFGGAIFNAGSSDFFTDPVVVLENSIVARNAAAGATENCSGPIVSEGYNIEDADTCGLAAAGDLSSADPSLGLLADNGGGTHTHALLPGSAAIDAGDNSKCPATDQRGVSRPIDGDDDGSAVCDIGAYEAEEATPKGTPTPVISPSPVATQAPGPVQLPATGGRFGTVRVGRVLAVALVTALVLATLGVGMSTASKGGRRR